MAQIHPRQLRVLIVSLSAAVAVAGLVLVMLLTMSPYTQMVTRARRVGFDRVQIWSVLLIKERGAGPVTADALPADVAGIAPVIRVVGASELGPSHVQFDGGQGLSLQGLLVAGPEFVPEAPPGFVLERLHPGVWGIRRR